MKKIRRAGIPMTKASLRSAIIKEVIASKNIENTNVIKTRAGRATTNKIGEKIKRRINFTNNQND